MKLFEHRVVLELQVDLLVELLDLSFHRLVLQHHFCHSVIIELLFEEQQFLVQLGQSHALLPYVVVF